MSEIDSCDRCGGYVWEAGGLGPAPRCDCKDDGQHAGEWCDPCPLDWAGRHKVGDHAEDREGR